MPRKSGGSTISRASVLNFLEAMREASVLSGEERTGKGDYPWVDKVAMKEDAFKRFVASTLL